MPKNDTNYLLYWRSDVPICPHCDQEYFIKTTDYNTKNWKDNHEEETTCKKCGKLYSFTINIEIKYTT